MSFIRGLHPPLGQEWIGAAVDAGEDLSAVVYSARLT